MSYAVEVHTYGLLVDRHVYSTKKEATSFYKPLFTKYMGSPSTVVTMRKVSGK